MGHTIRIMLVCAALGGCASTGMPSFSSIGGASEPEPAKSEKTASASTAAPAESTSSLSSIWKNFSSPFSSGAQPVSQKPGDKPFASSIDANEALRLINDFRVKKGLNPLSIDPQATAAAQALAKDMARHDHMSHVGPDGQDIGKRLLASGYSFRLAAENVSVGQASVDETIEGWKKSPPHSRNLLLAGAKHIGIAYEYKPDTKYKTFWTLVVVAP